MTYRNRKLLDACHDLPCTWPELHACVGAIEPAHSNQLRDGKGKGIKAPDYRIAALCHGIHSELDQGKRMSRAERIEGWEAAHRATIGLLFERGILGVIK